VIRLFAALSLSSDVSDRLLGVQAGLTGWRLSPEENFHVTLAFFGEIDRPTAVDLEMALGQVDGAAFEFWIDGVNVFGGPRPRLAYAAVRPEPALTLLRDKVRQAGRSAGLDLPSERYVPHVTLGRGGARADQRLSRWLEAGAGLLAGPVPAESFALFRSDLGRNGPSYTEIARYALSAR